MQGTQSAISGAGMREMIVTPMPRAATRDITSKLFNIFALPIVGPTLGRAQEVAGSMAAEKSSDGGRGRATLGPRLFLHGPWYRNLTSRTLCSSPRLLMKMISVASVCPRCSVTGLQEALNHH